MIRKIFVLLVINILFLTNTPVTLAVRQVGQSCGPSYPSDSKCETDKGYCCKLDKQTVDPNFPKTYSCQYDPICATFGKIEAPDPLEGMLEGDPTGAGAISKFLSNGINLIYSLAAIVLIFMIIWGAFQWLTSGGDKEQLASAQRRIIHAIIGIIIFAAAFAIISVLGTFTGFRFFNGQEGITVTRGANGIYTINCPGNRQVITNIPPTDLSIICR